MKKYGLISSILFFFKIGLTAADGCNVPVSNSHKDLGPMESWPVVHVPRYNMSAEVYRARLNNDSWERPADMPVLYVKAGTILDHGPPNSSVNNNVTLDKRGGWRNIIQFSQPDCQGSILFNTNFGDGGRNGCSSGCISSPTPIWSFKSSRRIKNAPILP